MRGVGGDCGGEGCSFLAEVSSLDDVRGGCRCPGNFTLSRAVGGCADFKAHFFNEEELKMNLTVP